MSVRNAYTSCSTTYDGTGKNTALFVSFLFGA
jgi:hypothetical protein